MENEKKTIIVPLPSNEESPAELSPTQLSNSLKATQLRIGNIMEKLIQSVQIGQTVMNTLRPALENFTNIISKVYDFSVTMKPMLDVLQQFSVYLSEAVANIKVPTLSEERKQELLESHRQWGRFGWTWFQDAPFSFYDTPPINYADANDKVKSLCSQRHIEYLLDELRQQQVNKADLKSAIFCYHNKQYKACALLLFGLIDAKLIRKQPLNEKRRKVGWGAVKQLRGQFEGQQAEQEFYMILFFANLITCLETLFADGEDFKIEPCNINRNFVDHGMNRRRVRKRDCIQLFMVLNNLLFFLDDMKSYVIQKED